jgi:NAD(P)-dependent dehydrogenase (short-subunit alcohol dehydrogenase family)
MHRFERSRILVTGGTKGIGAACVEQFAREGAELLVTWSRDDEAAAALRRRIEAIPARVYLFKADLGDGDAIEGLWKRLEAEHLLPDALVLNAAYQRKATVDETDPELFRRTLEANLVGNFRLARLYIASRRRAGAPGSIVVHSSNQAEFVNPTGFAYAVSKAGLNHLVRHLARSCASHRIRVNGIVLGWFDTEGERAFYDREPMRRQAAGSVPLGRIGEPEEAARLTVFLCSDDSSYMTGSLVRCDGGFALAPDLSS